MYIKQNKIIQQEPRKNIGPYNIQLNFEHTPVQVNGLKLIRKREIYNNYRKLIIQYVLMAYMRPPPHLGFKLQKEKEKML